MSRRLRSVPRMLANVLLAAVLAGCGGETPAARAPSKKKVPVAEPAGGLAVPALRATEIAKVPEGTFGPYVGESRDGALVVWAALDASGERSWFTLPVGFDGHTRGTARLVSPAPREIGLVAVRPSSDGAEVTLAATRRTALGEWIEVTTLAARGELLRPPRQLVELKTRALWIEIVPIGTRRLLLWAVPKDAGAEIFGMLLAANGEPEGVAELLASGGVRAWQAVPFAGGAALGTVRGENSVSVTFFDKVGRMRGKPTSVSERGRPTPDFDLAVLGESLLAAWSDEREGESRVYRAVIGADGAVSTPEAPLSAPFGEQVLVKLAAHRGSTRAWALWENSTDRRGDTRAFDVASIDPLGRIGDARGRVWLETEDTAVPEFAALDDGVAALTLASACPNGDTCDDADVLPTYVRFGSSLEVTVSEPLRLEALKGSPVELGWGLTCGDSHCFALSALGEAPAPVFVTALERRSTVWRAAGPRLGREDPPRVRENRVLAVSDALASVAIAGTSQGSLAGYLTDFDPTTPWVKLKKPASDGRFEPLRAALRLVGLRPDGTALAPPQDLSLRAHSLGGIVLAGGAPNGDVLAAWTGVDAGQPQVFLTLVGADGARHSQRMLTRKSGDASDIAVTALPKGWLVAWVDERDQDPELYASRVDEKLGRLGNEQRLTKAPGAATQVTLASTGDTGVVAWADARDPEQPGEADIFLARLSARDASAIGSEQRLLSTRGHSFAPMLRARRDGLVLVWLERGASDTPGSAGLMVQELGAGGERSGEPARIPLDAEPMSLALDCPGQECRVVVAVRTGDESELRAGVLRRAAPGELVLKRLLSLSAKGSVGIPLALSGDELVYADTDSEGRWRVRRALLDWP